MSWKRMTWGDIAVLLLVFTICWLHFYEPVLPPPPQPMEDPAPAAAATPWEDETTLARRFPTTHASNLPAIIKSDLTRTGAVFSPMTWAASSMDSAPSHFSWKPPGKRGIGYTLRDEGQPGSWTENMAKVRELRPYWNYSWGSKRVASQPSSIEFVPMIWGAWTPDDISQIWQQDLASGIQEGTIRVLLGFNEPDNIDQSNMSVADAISYWKQMQKIPLPLVSPSGQHDEGSWMQEFMRQAFNEGLRIDHVGVHWYGGASAEDFRAYLEDIYQRYDHRPLVVTEFAPTDWEATTPAANKFSPQQTLTFMKKVLPWMEATEWIVGYSWYPFEVDSAVGTSSALLDVHGQLTTLGRYYVSVTNEHPQGDQSITVG